MSAATSKAKNPGSNVCQAKPSCMICRNESTFVLIGVSTLCRSLCSLIVQFDLRTQMQHTLAHVFCEVIGAAALILAYMSQHKPSVYCGLALGCS